MLSRFMIKTEASICNVRDCFCCGSHMSWYRRYLEYLSSLLPSFYGSLLCIKIGRMRKNAGFQVIVDGHQTKDTCLPLCQA